MIDPSRIQITGPLQPQVEQIWSKLLAQGYTPLSGGHLLRLMAHLSRFMESKGRKPQELTNIP